MGRRNLTDEQKTYLIGKEYEAQKQTQGATDGFRGNQHKKVVSGQNDALPESGQKTRDVVARVHGIGSKSVERAEHFAKGLDAADEISLGFRESILTGTVKAPKVDIAAIAKMDEPERKKAESDSSFPPFYLAALKQV